MMPTPVIIGGGPAGAAAALALASAGARPVIYEQSAVPRHKVCGEFLTPEMIPLLEQMGLVEEFRALGPATVTHAELHFERSHRRFRLPEPACGLSRFAFDDFLLRAALARGADLRRERVTQPPPRAIHAAGRSVVPARTPRVFGFKAHFSGPANDAVELYFFPGGYCGICPIEGGSSNVCGLVEEEAFARHGFRAESLLATVPRLAARLAGLARVTRWLTTGPLRFGPARNSNGCLYAGDAACFVDPFTGSGLLAAVETGAWAGRAWLGFAQGGAWSVSRGWYERRRRGFYRRQLVLDAVARRLLALGWAESLARCLPGDWVFRLTRPGCRF